MNQTPPQRPSRLLGRLALVIPIVFYVGFVAAPLFAMAWETVAGPDGFGFSAWQQILADPVDRSQLAYSMALGLVATTLAVALGAGHAWLTHRTDLPGRAWLGPLGVVPLVVPPILLAMSTAEFMSVEGFWACAGILGVSYAPFVAVLTARGLRSVDGRQFEAALVARGRGPAERLLLRVVSPEILAGALLAFVFVISEHGVPEFLTVKGKAWHTYAEGVFARWTRRATGASHADIVSPIVAAVPLLGVVAVALATSLWLRARRSVAGDHQPLPVRSLGAWRWPALALPIGYLGIGLGLPVFAMGRWTAGSTQVNEPMSADRMLASFRLAVAEAGDDLGYTLTIAIAATVVLIAVAVPLARLSARRAGWIDHVCVLPIAVPAVLLGIGLVKVWNAPALAPVYRAGFDVYDSWVIVALGYAARFLPFGVLTLSSAVRRIPRSFDEAAAATGRSPAACFRAIHLPLMFPAIWSATCLAFILGLRELDLAVVLPAGNGTVVRRLSNVVHFGGEDMGGALALMLLLGALLVPMLTILLTGRKLRSLS